MWYVPIEIGLLCRHHCFLFHHSAKSNRSLVYSFDQERTFLWLLSWCHILNYVSIPLAENPSCLHTTVASAAPQKSSHTVPQMLLLQISTRPVMLLAPPCSLRAFWVQTTRQVESIRSLPNSLWNPVISWLHDQGQNSETFCRNLFWRHIANVSPIPLMSVICVCKCAFCFFNSYY